MFKPSNQLLHNQIICLQRNNARKISISVPKSGSHTPLLHTSIPPGAVLFPTGAGVAREGLVAVLVEEAVVVGFLEGVVRAIGAVSAGSDAVLEVRQREGVHQVARALVRTVTLSRGASMGQKPR